MIAALRAPKIKDIAVFDVAATAAAAAVATKASGWIYGTDDSIPTMIAVFVLLIVLGVWVHWFFDIPTRGNAYLGLASVEDVHAAR